jgi:mono/diheme cytochrome c family protein
LSSILFRDTFMKACETAVAVAVTILGFGEAHAQDVSFGAGLFHDKADCQFCHGINGDGRGDARSPGAAANLHETRLDREQLIEVIACGRPGTEMPHFDKYAYEDTDCYGLKGKNLGADAPHYPHSTPLTRREIEAIADYILTTFAGK